MMIGWQRITEPDQDTKDRLTLVQDNTPGPKIYDLDGRRFMYNPVTKEWFAYEEPEPGAEE